MRYGRCEIDRKYYDIAKAEIEAFCEKVYNSIREYGYNLSTTPIVFVGGGASVMKLFEDFRRAILLIFLMLRQMPRAMNSWL